MMILGLFYFIESIEETAKNHQKKFRNQCVIAEPIGEPDKKWGTIYNSNIFKVEQ